LKGNYRAHHLKKMYLEKSTQPEPENENN